MASPSFPPLIAQSTISSQVSTAGVQLISESRSWYHHVGVGCLHVSVLETSMLYFKDLRSHSSISKCIPNSASVGMVSSGNKDWSWDPSCFALPSVHGARVSWREVAQTGSNDNVLGSKSRCYWSSARRADMVKWCQMNMMIIDDLQYVSIPYRNPTSKRIITYWV